MAEAEAELQGAQEQLRNSEENMLSCLREARKLTGLNKGAKDKPPQEVQDYWDQVINLHFSKYGHSFSLECLNF